MMDRVKEIFQKFAEAHPYIRSGDNDQQRRIVDALQPLIDEAETLGVPQGFSEAILFWGKSFLDFEFPDVKKKTESLKAHVQRDEPDPQVIMAQRTFGVKATLMTFGEREAAEIANVLVYKILGHTQKQVDEDGRPTGKYTPDIEILLRKKSKKISSPTGT